CERWALEVDVDGLGLAGGEAEHSSGQAEPGCPTRHGRAFGWPVGGVGAPGRTTQDGAADGDPRTGRGERCGSADGGDEHRQEEQVDKGRTETTCGVDDFLAADDEVGDLQGSVAGADGGDAGAE